MNDSQKAMRVTVLQIGFVLAFLFLSVRLWGLQIGRGEQYVYLANQNRFRLATVDAPRGVIYDRNGTILVRNVPSFSLSIVPASLPEDPQELAKLCDRLTAILAAPVADQAPWSWLSGTVSAAAEGDPPAIDVRQRIAEIQEQVKKGRISRYAAVPLAVNVPRDIAFVAEEEHLNLPGVIVEIKPRRNYLYGPLLAHWLGYVGAIPADQVQAYLAAEGEDYEANDQVGLTGVELTFEQVLRGTKGKKHVEVDAFEREIRILATKPAQPGYNLILTLDVELQRVAEEALRARMEKVGSSSGTVIAMNPQNGEILAMVSLPTYDNNLFSGGISLADYQALINDPLSPLLNHAIGGEYPPGSTFKIVPAAAALEEKVITADTRLYCSGVLWLPNEFMPDDPSKAQPFYCWVHSGHGAVNLISSLAYSCDIYYYQVGGGFADFKGLGLERLTRYAREFGFGARTGIALPGEAAGLVPTERWKRENWDMNWVMGDTYNISIGQGYILSTPLQLLNAFAAIANGGTLYRPQVVHQIVDVDGNLIQTTQPEVIRQVPISPQNIELVRSGMRAAATWGTARLLDQMLPEIHAAGKTGTAEFPGERDEEGNLPTHAWFGAFAPYESPEIAVVVFIAGGGQGAVEAVPVAIEVLRHYFQLSEPTPVPD